MGRGSSAVGSWNAGSKLQHIACFCQVLSRYHEHDDSSGVSRFFFLVARKPPPPGLIYQVNRPPALILLNQGVTPFTGTNFHQPLKFSTFGKKKKPGHATGQMRMVKYDRRASALAWRRVAVGCL